MSDFCKSCKNKGNIDICCACTSATIFDKTIGKPTNYSQKENISSEKHLKGYMFDSLVYRYQLALEQRVETLARQYIQSGKYSTKIEAEAYVRQHENKRDLMAFIRILDEAIGEHD